MLATEITAPEKEAKLGGKTVRLRFDHNQMRQSEIYYQNTVLRKLGYIGIVDQLLARTYIGLGAIAYGAAASAQMAEGRIPMAMREFDRDVSYDELRAAAQTLVSGVMESMPKGGAKKEDGPVQ